MRLAGIILAGGRGTRFGSPLKCLPLLPRLVQELRRVGCDRIIIADGHAGAALTGCIQVDDVRPGCGPLGGLVAGLDASAGCQAAIIVAGDQLRLGASGLTRLVHCWRRQKQAVVAAQVAARRRTPARIGILGLLPAQHWPLAAERLALGRLGIHRLWRAAQARPVWFSAAELADLDRPGDLLKFRAARRH